MKAIYQTKGSRQVDIHYADVGVPGVGVVEESFGGYYLGNGDLYLEDVIQDQESVYQSLQTNGRSDRAKASTSTDSVINNEQNGGNGRVPKKEGECSQVCNVESQLALDEALALALQEMENHLGSVSLNDTTGTQGDRQEMSPTQPSAVNREVNTSGTSGTSVQAVGQDNIDPDNMTYEELQSLGEAIGTESKGLSDELISYLPSFKYKIGFFSKKEKHDECVICCMEYKNRDVLTILPCQHQYHSKCVTRWLKLNKACPVCNEEVFGA